MDIKSKNIFFIIKTTLKQAKYLFFGTLIEILVFLGIYYLANRNAYFLTKTGFINKSIIVMIPTLLTIFFMYSSRVFLPLYGWLSNLSILKALGFYKKNLIKVEVVFLFLVSFVVCIPLVLVTSLLFKNIGISLFILALIPVMPLISMFWYYLTNVSSNYPRSKKLTIPMIAGFMPLLFIILSFIYSPELIMKNKSTFYGLSFINPLLSINVIYLNLLRGTFHLYYILPLVLWSLIGSLLYVQQYRKQKFISDKRNPVKSFTMNELTVGNRLLIKNINLKLENSIIIGENGAGKTCLLKAIYEQYSQSNGYIFYLSPETENTRVFNGYYPLEIIRRVIQNNKNIAPDLEKVMKLIKEHFGDDLNKKIGNLSGGQKQLTNILIGIFGDFDMLLMDELEKSLSKDKILILLKLISKHKKQCTKVFVTHDQSLFEIFDDYKKILIKDNEMQKLSGKIEIAEVI
ncbi:ABC transporter domain-containing protein [Mycoplasma marinum]